MHPERQVLRGKDHWLSNLRVMRVLQEEKIIGLRNHSYLLGLIIIHFRTLIYASIPIAAAKIGVIVLR